MSAEHYTAVVEVSKVTDAKPAQVDRYGNVTAEATPRTVSEVTRLVLRADTLDELKTRVAAHVELVAE